MFFILSKLVLWLIMPFNICLALLIISLVIKKKSYKKVTQYAGIGLLVLFSNPLLSNWVMNQWEPDAVHYSQINQTYDWGIVLGGITEPNRPPYDRIHFNKGADRIVHAIELYKQGKIKKILISGGSGVIGFEGKKESHALADFAILSGVNPTDVFIEDQSKNTHENALFSKRFIQPEENTLLFTSAFHMKRAKGSFHKQNILADTFPTDYYGGLTRLTPYDLIIPNLYSMKLWSILMKEWVGYLSYGLVGYV